MHFFLSHRLRNIHECSSDNSSLLTATSFALSCICHGTIQPHPTKLAPIIYCAASLVLSKTCPAQVVTHALKCLAYISIDLREVFTVGAFPLTQRLVQLVSSESHQELALRTLIHICRGPEFHIRVVLSSGILDISEDVLKESNSSALKIDMCKLFSEMRSKQVLQLIDKPEILNAITGLSLEGACEWPVRKEAIAVVFNIALRAREYSHFQALVRNHTIEAVVDALHIRIDNALVLTALDCVERLLAFGEQNNEPYGLMIDQCGGIDKIEDLSNHNCSDIAKSAAWILDTYNTEEDSLDGEDWRLNLSTSPELYHHDPIFFQDALDSQP
jgi:importin subunit alpha-1